MDLRHYHLDIEIQELALIGFAPQDVDSIRVAIVAEVQRLVQTQGLPSGVVTDYRSYQDGGQIDGATTDARTLGTEIAQVIYRGLKP